MSSSTESARPTEQSDLDRAIDELQLGAAALVRTSAAAKARLVRECLALARQLAPEWSRLGSVAKRLPPDHPEEWFGGPLPAITHLRLLADSLDQIAAAGRPAMGSGIRQRTDGRLEVAVFPASGLDRVLLGGVRAHVLLRQGVDRAAAIEAQARFYRHIRPEPTVALVLGAGNASSLPLTDVLSQVFNEGRATLLKMNPVNEWFGPVLTRILAPLIDADFLRVVYGGAETGQYLATHSGIGWIHVTGSASTHDRLLWGPPGPDHDRRRCGELPPLVSVPVSSELGNITPIAIVPDAYQPAELAFQARSVATMVSNNASFNCLSARMLVTAKDWPQREEFLRLVLGFLAGTPTRYAYYPGAGERFRRFTDGRAVRSVGDPKPGELPWALIPDLDSTDTTEPLFSLEPFCCVLAEVPIDGAGPVAFLQSATRFMNDVLWGTLCATIVISPRVERDPEVAIALDRAVTDLRYGNVAINAWPGVNVALAALPWGGYPTGPEPAPAADRITQSGTGFVHNTCMLGEIDKGVVRAGLTMHPTPPWFSDNPAGTRVAPVFVDLMSEPRWRQLPGLLSRLSG